MQNPQRTIVYDAISGRFNAFYLFCLLLLHVGWGAHLQLGEHRFQGKFYKQLKLNPCGYCMVAFTNSCFCKCRADMDRLQKILGGMQLVIVPDLWVFLPVGMKKTVDRGYKSSFVCKTVTEQPFVLCAKCLLVYIVSPCTVVSGSLNRTLRSPFRLWVGSVSDP